MGNKAVIVKKRDTIYFLIWISATIFLGWQLWLGQQSTNLLQQWPTFITLAIISLTLISWTPNPIPRNILVELSKNRIGGFIVFILAVCGLFALPVFVGAQLLWLLPILAVVVLLIIRKPLERNEIGYAFILSVIAGLTAYWAGWISQFPPLTWSVLQFLVVLTGCAGGWQLIRVTGLLQMGVGQSCVLRRDFATALRHFVCGIVIAIPWAMGIIVLGGARTETWVLQWWQPFIAIQPAIAEEVWGRLLLVPVFYVLIRHVYKPRESFTVALVIVGYWFAFLHTVGSPAALVNTLFTGSLYAMPISFLCLYKDFETAVGFHFCVDFVKFLSAHILFQR